MNIKILRTNALNTQFIALVKRLDASLAITDGDEHAFYDQFNKLHDIKYVLLLFENEKPIACGAIKEFDKETMEIKRMYTTEEKRRLGYASRIISNLEIWAKELGFNRCILETGKRQVSAIQLYKNNNYQIIPNYGQYIGVKNSVCFEKKISPFKMLYSK